jgi:hypothetical protein
LARHSSRLLNADAAGVLLADADGQVTDVATSSEMVRRLQSIQLHRGTGPSMMSYRDRLEADPGQ